MSIWGLTKELWMKDRESRWLFWVVGAFVLLVMVCYGAAALLVVGLVHEVRDQGLRSVVERIWNGPER